MKRILIFFFPAALFFSAFLIIPAFPASENSLIYLRSSDATSLDPLLSRDKFSSEVILNIFEGLVRFKKGSLDIEPCIAESWQVKDDGKKWLFFIRKGITFHNREECSAHSVVASFQRNMEEKAAPVEKWEMFYPYIKTIKALDKYTVEICLTQPYAPLLAALTTTSAVIAASASYTPDGFKPIGTGPFMFERWEKGNYLAIKRNDYYWDGPVLLSGVIFKTIANPAARTMQVKTGNADITRIRSAREYEEFYGKKEISICSSPSFRVHYLAFNTRKFPFTKIETRKAMAHLINKSGLVKHIYQNLAIPAITPIPPQLFGFNAEINDFDYNIPKAKELLRQAGLEKGFSCNLYFSGKNIGQLQLANIITKNAKRVNINIKKVPLSFKELVDRCDRGEHDLVIMGWMNAPDPDLFFYPLFTNTRGNVNRSFYQNPQLTSLLDKAKAVLDLEERIRYYKEAQVIIHRDVPWIPLFHLKSLAAHQKRVKNLYFNPNDVLIFRHTTKEE